MSYLHDFAPKKNLPGQNLSSLEKFSVFYHNIFEYPLTFSELVKWTPGKAPDVKANVGYKNGYYFVEGSGRLVLNRALRKRFSQKKIKIAKKAARIISLNPNIKMVGVTGSLAMENAKEKSDIDLIIITKKGRLWTTRLATYFILKLFGLPLRRPKSVVERDRLCLNIWLDESDLTWGTRQRSHYTAHEIIQIKPLINRDRTFERFLWKNKWVKDFWPNAADIKPTANSPSYTKLRNINLMEKLAYKIQYIYMKSKITHETISSTRAIFHPNDLSAKVRRKLELDRHTPSP